MIAASSSASGQCFVLHPARHEVVARFRVGGPAARVLIDPLTGLVVVARADGVLAFVDPSSWRVVRLLATGVASLAGAVFADRRGTIVLHGLAGGAEVNTLTRVVTPFVIAEDAQATIYHPDMDVFWVASSGSPSTVFAYGPATLTGAYVPASFALLAPFVAFALSSVNGLVYTAVSGSDSVQVLPTDSSDVVLGGGVATAIAENPRTKRLYVGMTGVGGVSVVNPAGFLAIVSSYQRCALPGGAPTTMAFCPSNGLMYAATAASSIVSAVS
jgi:DNA-binding beta-propeller fold protein YncE